MLDVFTRSTEATGTQLAACGPVLDQRAADRVRDLLESRQAESPQVRSHWPALAPIFGASAYLATLVRQDPLRLQRLLADPPHQVLLGLIAAARDCRALDLEPARKRLRQLKGDLHLLCAIQDLGGLWDLDQVTGALSQFADASLQSALALAARQESALGFLVSAADDDPAGPVPGLFCLAMGKHGAFELNYSSDIDITVFFDPDRVPVAQPDRRQAVLNRVTLSMAAILQDRTPEGYVFRVDLRLRPDPSSTPPAISLPSAFDYYESVGQNWERAAFIKARVAAGDLAAGQRFLADLAPFIWRRNLDFAAIADIHSIKRQIHAHKVDDSMDAAGADLKLGRGGIREIEFFVQTQQLILGGRHPELRSNRTLDALAALVRHGQVTPETGEALRQSYTVLRALEHRVQMLADEQTHRLPRSEKERKAVAALSGFGQLRSFDARVVRVLKAVNGHYAELFAGEEALSSRFGSLIFTGVEDDPETLATLGRMGFSRPDIVSGTIRGWHHGRIPATRTERGRELFTRLAPQLLDAFSDSGAPDAAFNHFGDFFAGLRSGVQVQSLFLAQPGLLKLVVEVMAFAPRLAGELARRPAALDALLDSDFLRPVVAGEITSAVTHAMSQAEGFEAMMDAARRCHREQAFRIGVQIMSRRVSAAQAGEAFADLADVSIRVLAGASLAETQRQAGAFDGEVAVVAMGKCGSREMTATSDLDLMTVYQPAGPQTVSALKGWAGEVFFGRFTQRLIAALSAPTAEGSLYEVDMKLRPSGSKGPVAVSLGAFLDYYPGEAETWEFQALTRARVVWASSPAFEVRVRESIDRMLALPRDRARTAFEVADMRALMERERPPSGDWDLKLSSGGLVDIEFITQFLMLERAVAGHPVEPNSARALEALMAASGDDDGMGLAPLREALQFQQTLSQMLKLALTASENPDEQPKAFRSLLARSVGVRDFRSLKTRLRAHRRTVRKQFNQILGANLPPA